MFLALFVLWVDDFLEGFVESGGDGGLWGWSCLVERPELFGSVIVVTEVVLVGVPGIFGGVDEWVVYAAGAEESHE